MAKAAKIAWGVDVGNCTLKALKLGVTGGGVEILDFVVIEHEKILSQPDLDSEQRTELVSEALGTFLMEHDVKGSAIVVSVPGQNSFARFIKLPPVESKRIPELVKFEAIQQIPFDINDVEWDWQTFEQEQSPEVEVGIFAIKKDLVAQALEPFTITGCAVTGVQMAPIALYNFLRYDQKRLADAAGKEAIIAIDIGAENTNLVIADGLRVWQRNIPIGGNHFTAAVQKAFKLSFAKAEAIKKTANTSKYARQIFQAMRSVFADLAAEVQRSLGFYSSSNRNVQFREVLALGNAMKLPGLVKFLQQSLSLPVKRMDSFESATLGPDVSAAKFAECLPSLGVVYGLGLQGLGLSAISSDLLPANLARQSQWKRKRGWFAASVGIVLIGSLVFLAQAYSQKADIESKATKDGENTVKQLSSLINSRSGDLKKYESEFAALNTKIDDYMKYYGSRTILPLLMQTVRLCTPNEENVADPTQREILQAYREGNREVVMSVPREDRGQIFITSMKYIYTDNLDHEFNAVAQQWMSSSMAHMGGGGGMGGGDMGMAGGADRGMMGMAGGADRGMMGMGGPAMGGPAMGGPAMGGPAMGGPGMGGAAAAVQTSESGYVIIIEGYTPHKDNLAFLYRPDAGLDRTKWGFFNRLQFLGKTDAQIIKERQEQASANQGGGGAAGGGGAGPATRGPGVSGAGPGGLGRRSPGPGGPASPGAAATAGGGAAASAEPETVIPEGLKPPETEVQAAMNQASSQLPFETYIDTSKSLRNSFDTTENGWVSFSQMGSQQLPQPSGIGIPKPVERTRSILGRTETAMPMMEGFGGDRGMGMGGDRGLAGGMGMGGGMGRLASLSELIDPFTFETISTTYAVDKDGQKLVGPDGQWIIEKHDYWFRLKFKVKLKGSEKESPENASAGPAGSGAGRAGNPRRR